MSHCKHENGLLSYNSVWFKQKMSNPNTHKLSLREQVAAAKEDKRRKMMRDAVSQLKYFNIMKDTVEYTFADGMPDDSNDEAMNPAHAELMKFINTRLHELQIDAAGGKRYNYKVNVAEDNGDDISHSEFNFKTSDEVYSFIHEKTMSEDGKLVYDYESEPYTIPTAAEIDVLMDKARHGYLMEVFSCGTEHVFYASFTVVRQQVN